jgi:hypothetical protein
LSRLYMEPLIIIMIVPVFSSTTFLGGSNVHGIDLVTRNSLTDLC